ncbi:neutral/alkaline nonlysosomal ceramidase [Ophiocordyceps camponoti-floridani]|uniref:Neutral ceramidase n=1 Tax=Ophiocordyceps camponoti-floridani TaxID=2030778 RepID=A0A8H4Q9T8_9HYPO|nr:neutral/alkaline nonlysosomal ceramidase [Ophiocordyceps camponoti-floridani]
MMADARHGGNDESMSPRRRFRPCLSLLVVLVAAAVVLALSRASGWTGVPPRLSSSPLHLNGPNVDDNGWAGLQLPEAEAGAGDGLYLLGVGKADITGPVVELNLMGYADFTQMGSGLRQRLYSRAFIVGDVTRPRDRFVYLVLDIQSGDTAVRYGVLRGLSRLGPRYSMYRHDNVAVTATHSHSGPGAWLNYLLPQIPSRGFDRQSFQAIVDGCLLSIRRAHESLAPGELTVGSTKLVGAGINRSLFSYMANPEAERARYNISAQDDGSVDTDMTMLSFRRASDRRNIGLLTWFPTHGTSMQANNTLISGDNKGVAADMLEKALRADDATDSDFVAGFSQANMGDVSPNVLGAWCQDGSGQRCRLEDSTCADGRGSLCRARGPGRTTDDHGASSCLEIGRRQFRAALDLYRLLDRQPANVRGEGVKAFHRFHDMAGFSFRLPNGSEAVTCAAALGYSFGAGTWDEPGSFDLVQHLSAKSKSSFLWPLISWLIRHPTPEQSRCQEPKTILLDVGDKGFPYAWTPNVVDVQTLRVGQLLVIVSPGEATTMAGRRWKRAVADEATRTLADELGGREPVVVLGAPSNSYTHYITTEEEYGVQRYEGASTLYGRHTLAAHMDRSVASVAYLRSSSSPPPPGRVFRPQPEPPDNSNRSWSLIAGVVYDRAGRNRRFGDVTVDVKRKHFRAGDVVSATFVGANPRNNLRLEQTYAAVERRQSSPALQTRWRVALSSGGHQALLSSPPGGGGGTSWWRTVRDDSDWALTFHWRRKSALLGTSEVRIEWEVEDDVPAGEYRLRYYGDYKSLGGRIEGFEGTSGTFYVE